MAAARVVSVHIGQIAPLGPDAVPSGFVKHPVAAAIQVTALGLVGDQQADLRVHGGPDKAIYGYSMTHYAAWRSEYPQHSDLLVPGGFGGRFDRRAINQTLAALASSVQGRSPHENHDPSAHRKRRCSTADRADPDD